MKGQKKIFLLSCFLQQNRQFSKALNMEPLCFGDLKRMVDSEHLLKDGLTVKLLIDDTK